MVTITTNPISLVSIDLKLVTDLVTGTTTLGNVSHLGDVNRLIRHPDRSNFDCSFLKLSKPLLVAIGKGYS